MVYYGMKTNNRPEPPSHDSIRKFLEDWGGDGWSILDSKSLVEGYGFPLEWSKSLERTFKSDFSDHKSTIYSDDGQPLKSLKGVSTLSVIRRLGALFDVPMPHYNGRGREARAYTEGILAQLDQVS